MNRCRWCHASLALEIESDVLQRGGVCSECVREEEQRRYEEREDDDEEEPGPNGCACGFNGDCNCPFVSSAAADTTSLRRNSSQ